MMQISEKGVVAHNGLVGLNNDAGEGRNHAAGVVELLLLVGLATMPALAQDNLYWQGGVSTDFCDLNNWVLSDGVIHPVVFQSGDSYHIDNGYFCNSRVTCVKEPLHHLIYRLPPVPIFAIFNYFFTKQLKNFCHHQ